MERRQDRETILVVDDQPENIHILMEHLEDAYEVLFATNGEKALGIAHSENRPDLILLDIIMPMMDGYEICQRLKSDGKTRDIPVIFVTGSGQRESEAKGLELGAADFITKPFRMPIVLARIKAVLRLKREMDRRKTLAERLEDLNRHLEERIQDSTLELRRIHENLKVSERKHRAIYENAIEGIFQMSGDGHLLSANPSFAYLLGYASTDELLSRVTDIGRQLYARPEDHGEFKRILDLKGTISGFVTRFTNKNGDLIDVMISAKTIRDEKGNLLHYQGFSIDISDQKRTEQTLRQREAHLRTLIKTIPDLVWLKDPDGVYLSCNPRLERFFGARESQIIGKTDYDFVSKELADFFSEQDRAAVAAGRPTMNEEELVYADDGHGELLETVKTPMYDSAGRFIGVLGIARDITERKQAEKEKARMEDQYRQAQKMEAIGRLAGGVAHDLNNLLTPILGYGEMLLGDFGATDSRRRRVELILQAAFRSRDLVRQLLAFSRKQSMQYKAINLNRAVADFEKLMRRTIREDIEISVILAADIPPIMADIGQIEQVIMNLAVNAADAMPEGGRLTIETALSLLDETDMAVHPEGKPGRYVKLTVSDTGCGMDEETREHLFEPFFSTKGDQGTGLGLATVHGIVKQHRGTIRVHSEPKKGASFEIYLPFQEDLAMEKETGGETDSLSGGAETILLVEDNEQVRDLTHDVLTELGYGVLVAKSAAEALRILDSNGAPVHLLLTDVIMPGMNGKELFTRAAEKRPNLRVLYMSGYTDNVIAHQGVLNEGVHFIQKPFTLNALLLSVKEALA
jgi:PAS domain S-box-containing protein